MTEQPPISLDYAAAEVRPLLIRRVVGAFIMATFLASVLGSFIYGIVVNRYDESVSVLIMLGLMLTAWSAIVCVWATWWRLRRADVRRARSLLVAALIGSAYGLLPAAGFAYTDHFPESSVYDFAFGSLVIFTPILLPYFMYHRDKLPPAY